MEDLNNPNNNGSQDNNEELNNNEVQSNNEVENNNVPNSNEVENNNVQANRTGEGSGQIPQNNNVNNTQNINSGAKKKSKAPVIIIVVIIVVLLLGCLTIGGIVGGIMLFKNKAERTYENVANELNNLKENRVYNSTKNTSNNSSNNTSTNTTNNTSKNNTTSNNIANTTTNTNTTSNSTVTDAKESTKENPLSKGEWGIASKYSTESKDYEDVYIKVTNVVRGEEAKEEVQNYINKSSYYKYEEPKEGLEWVVLDYDLDFANYTKSTYGASADVTTSIKGIGDHTSVVYNGTTYILTSTYIGSRDYVKTQTATGKIAFQMPIGCTDYIVQFGTYNETNAYFKGE